LGSEEVVCAVISSPEREQFNINVKSVPLEAAFEPSLGEASTPKSQHAEGSGPPSRTSTASLSKHELVEMIPVHRGSWNPRVVPLKQV